MCELLREDGKPVRGLVRPNADAGKLERLQSMGVDLVYGDVHDRAALDKACQGATAVISTISAMPMSYDPDTNNIQQVDLEGVTRLVDAAKAAGVKRFIYTSLSRNMDLDYPLRNAKRAVERYLQNSGLTYTILRPSYFMETWLSPAVGFDYANANAVVYGSGQNPISYIAGEDVAQFAVKSLDNPAARNATLELGGPEALNPLQVVKLFEMTGGTQFEVTFVPEEALAAQQQEATDPMQQSFAGLMRCYARGDVIDMVETSRVFSVKPTTVRDYATSAMRPA